MKDVALAAIVWPATVSNALGEMFGESSSFVFDDEVILSTCLVVRQSTGER